MTPTPASLGFSSYLKGFPERSAALVEELDDLQIEQLTALEKYRKEYFHDLRLCARREIQSLLLDATAHPDAYTDEEVWTDLSVKMAHLAVSMTDSFTLMVAEIVHYGCIQGEMPPFESTRYASVK